MVTETAWSAEPNSDRKCVANCTKGLAGETAMLTQLMQCCSEMLNEKPCRNGAVQHS